MTDAGTADAQDRLIIALDVPNAAEARELVAPLKGVASFFKVGYELFIAEGMPFVRELLDAGNRVFLDLKIDDVDETVRRAVSRVAAEDGIQFLTIYGGRATAEAALKACEGTSLKLLQVSALTSLSDADLADMGLVGEGNRFDTREQFVIWRAQQSLKHGCHGIITSGKEAKPIRDATGDDLIIVTPGIRPASAGTDEHAVPTTPSVAIRNGSDYLVIGRPITRADDPADAAREILAEMQEALDGR